MNRDTLNPAMVKEFINTWKVYRDDIHDPTFKSAAEIRAIQDKLLQKQVIRLAGGSKFYKNVFREYGIDPTGIQSVDDLEKMPLTTKKDYMTDPDAFRLKFDEDRIENNLWEVNYTTGTTAGRPSPFYITVHDMYAAYLSGMRMYKIAMLSPDGINVNLYPFGPLPHIGYTRMFTRTAGLSRPWVSPSIGMKYDEIPIHRSLDYAFELIEAWNIKPLLLGGIPSFIRRLIISAEEQKRNFSMVKDIHIGGEPFNKVARDDVKARLANMGATDVKITNVFGFTELQTSTAECCEFGGNHFSSLDFHYFEVVDSNGKRLPDGETGQLAVTHLNARGTSLVRFLSGDLVQMTQEQCPYCGRNGGRLINQGSIIATRSSDMVKVKGTLINPNILKEGILGIKGIGEYQIVIDLKDARDPYSGDALIIRIFAERDQDRIKRETIDFCRNAIEMTPKIEWVDEARSIYDMENTFKSVRLIDRRPKVN